MLAKLEYVSVGCSRTPHAADWSSNGLLAYAASNSVAIAKETEVSFIRVRLANMLVIEGGIRSN